MAETLSQADLKRAAELILQADALIIAAGLTGMLRNRTVSSKK